MKEQIDSTLVPNGKAKFVRTISTKKIINKYNKSGFDSRYLFNDKKEIAIYECLNTTYRFYYPFEIAGDSAFYEFFQKFEWYYMPWKWEHEITKDYLKDDMSVLEVGCAHGAFLKKINEEFKLKNCVGLELNKSTPNESNQWIIINQYVQDYEKENQEKFDLVCSFQVLEHIADVHSFIKAKIGCLKKGGKLIISVPNNDSFIKDSDTTLNLPPHHMGLWDTKSLKSLVNIFPIKLVKIHYEKLQDYHVDSHVNNTYYSKYDDLTSKFIRKWHKITGKYQKRLTQINNNKDAIIGHTILAVYEKL